MQTSLEPEIRSFRAEYFIRQQFAAEGVWRDIGCHLETAEQAAEMARRMLNRIVKADPHAYFPTDITLHIRTFASPRPVDTRLRLD